MDRLTLNNNTKTLILKVFEGSASYTKTKRTVHAVIGKLQTNFQEEALVDRTIRQVFAMLRSYATDEQFKKAEDTLRGLEQKFPGRADIYSTLGWVYKRDDRPTDAREMFKRAVELKCKSQEVYWHWSELEASESEWNESLRVAELGLQSFPGHRDLLYCLGYAQHRAGRDLIRDGQASKGQELCLAAEGNLNEFLTTSARRTELQTSRALRGLVLNADVLGDGKSVNRYLLRWRQECGSVGNWQTEHDRLRAKYPGDVQRASELPQLIPRHE